MSPSDLTVPIRSFVGAFLDDALIDRIRLIQEQLAQQLRSADVRWTAREQLHLTLKFFGTIKAGDLPPLKLALQNAIRGIAPIHLVPRQLGCFPSLRRASIIWLGLEGDLATLNRLQSQIESETNRFGNHSEKHEFHPHLTIGRGKSPRTSREVGRVVGAAAAKDLGEWRMDSIALMQSQLAPQGSQYGALAKWDLGGG